MRLIDADVFEKFIKEKYKDGESTDDVKEQMLFDLSYQPTAYNVDKVVEELEMLSTEVKMILPFSKEAIETKLIESGEAIEIIRRGGVE